jgi:hypothetical protein
MKRLIYFIMALLGFSAASCEEHGAVMPMYACPAPEQTQSKSEECGEEQAEVNVTNEVDILQ